MVVTGRNNKFKAHDEKLGVKYVNLDLNNVDDFNQLPTKEVEGVILLAGLLPANAPVNLDEDENAADYFRINVIGTINVLEYCRKNGIQRVISTCSYADVRGAWSSTKRITEDEPRDFIYTGDHAVYVISKNAANDVLEYYTQQHGMKNAVFRFPTVYGVTPHMSLYVNGERRRELVWPEDMPGGNELDEVIFVKDLLRASTLFANKSIKAAKDAEDILKNGSEEFRLFNLISKEGTPKAEVEVC